jgi:hypothetical protein
LLGIESIRWPTLIGRGRDHLQEQVETTSTAEAPRAVRQRGASGASCSSVCGSPPASAGLARETPGPPSAPTLRWHGEPGDAAAAALRAQLDCLTEQHAQRVDALVAERDDLTNRVCSAQVRTSVQSWRLSVLLSVACCGDTWQLQQRRELWSCVEGGCGTPCQQALVATLPRMHAWGVQEEVIQLQRDAAQLAAENSSLREQLATASAENAGLSQLAKAIKAEHALREEANHTRLSKLQLERKLLRGICKLAVALATDQISGLAPHPPPKKIKHTCSPM